MVSQHRHSTVMQRGDNGVMRFHHVAMRLVPNHWAVLAALWLWAGLAGAQAQSVDEEQTTAKYQSTFNWQRHPAFASAYAGANSLTAGADTMYTFSATAHWGARVWSGGELYFNPEATSGVPFSKNLVGLGGFTNGEITRAAGTQLTLYRQRLFLRQTWNRGGGSEKQDADFNQLAGTVDKNRTVLTVGNFSTLDVFDDNAYAKDPRTQFMNWGNWTYAAYDYAADARGFGWGFALEWYQDDWVLRLGRMSGPKEPNGLQVDFQLGKHYGDQVELQHKHRLAEQPGQVSVLAWRNRANLADFGDALNYLKAHPGADPQAFFQVRNGDKTHYGLGINMDQAFSDDLGVFLRAMKTNGHYETYAFTEVDNSFSGGAVLKGSRWGRAHDTLGLAWMCNGLSAQRRQFLQAGGVSFFIGDGALNYRPEKILEAFYSLQVNKFLWLTGDYQRIQNPAFNASRGPVNVYALRLHAEF
jgi:high affinity Mn2+ porin